MQPPLSGFALDSLTTASIVPAFLMLTLLSCWFLPRSISWLLAGVTVVAGLWLHVLTVIALLPLALMFVSVWHFSSQWHQGRQAWLSGAAFVVLAFLLATHRFPGFHNILIWDQPVKPDSIPFNFFLNVDKPWPALAILLFFTVPDQGLLQSPRQWRQAARLALLPIALLLVVITGLAWLFGFIRLQPGLTEITGLFLLSNLLLTSVVEGVMLRGFLQRLLMQKFGQHGLGLGAALAIPAMIFGLTFYSSGFAYMGVVFIANLFYGWIYLRSNSLEMSVLGQWLLNTVLFLFFTYPA